MRPESDLPQQLPTILIPSGTKLMRIHARGRHPLWFGPARGGVPVNRFDDPRAEFQVCYLGATIEACFAETFLRNPPVRILAVGDLARRVVTTIEVRRALHVAALYGPGLARLGATAELTGGGDYPLSRAWSRALWAHENHPDGIAYRSRHDDSALSVALFGRARGALEVLGARSLVDNPQLLAELLGRYGLALTP